MLMGFLHVTIAISLSALACNRFDGNSIGRAMDISTEANVINSCP